ncbi:MAG: zf-HC2 domain-containing protein [Clostridia bacterium]
MNNCEKYENLISLYLDDMLLATEVEELLEHLDSCENCHAYYTDLKCIKESIKNIKIEYPEDLTTSILDKIQLNKEVQIVQYKPRKQKVFYGMLASCACAAILISTSSFYNNNIDTTNGTVSYSKDAEPQNMDMDTGMTVNGFIVDGEPIQSFPADVKSFRNEILLDEYAFVYEFEGYADITGITERILHIDGSVTYLEVANTISNIESLIKKLETYDYEYLAIDNNEFRINKDAKNGIFIINKK